MKASRSFENVYSLSAYTGAIRASGSGPLRHDVAQQPARLYHKLSIGLVQSRDALTKTVLGQNPPSSPIVYYGGLRGQSGRRT